MAIITHETLNIIGINSQIAAANVDNRESYRHIYIIINGYPREPRYLGLYLQNNINYNNPYKIYNSTEEYIEDGYTIFPSINAIINLIMENIFTIMS